MALQFHRPPAPEYIVAYRKLFKFQLFCEHMEVKKMERLEQILYQPRQVLERPREQLYKTSDLEQLSVVVLYTGDIKISPIKAGMSLPGGLEIYKVQKNTVTLKQDFGLLRDLYSIHPDGHGSLKNIALTYNKGKSTLLNKKSW